RRRLHPDPAAFPKHTLWPASNRPLDGASPTYTAAPPSRISAGLLHLTDFARHGRHASLVLPYREPRRQSAASTYPLFRCIAAGTGDDGWLEAYWPMQTTLQSPSSLRAPASDSHRAFVPRTPDSLP